MPFVKQNFLRVAGGFLPFWFYITLFKFGAGIHYATAAILGAQVFPLWAVGLCVGLMSFIQLVLDIPAGFMLERHGYLRMLRLTTLCFIGAAFVLLFGLTPLTYMLSIVFSGFGWLFFTPGINAYLMAHSPVPVIGRLFGLKRAAEGMGTVLALIGLPFFAQLPPFALGLVMLYPLLGALVALAIAVRNPIPTFLPKCVTVRRHAAQAGWKELHAAFLRLHPVGTALGLYTFCTATFYGLLWFIFPLIVVSEQGSGIVSGGLAMLDLAMIAAGLTIGRFADTARKNVLITVGLAVFVACAWAIGFTLHPVFLLLCFGMSFANETVSTTLWAWLDAKAAGGRQQGVITGAVTFLEDLGWMLGPITAGLLYGIFSPFGVMHIGAAVVLVAAVLVPILLLPTRTLLRRKKY